MIIIITYINLFLRRVARGEKRESEIGVKYKKYNVGRFEGVFIFYIKFIFCNCEPHGD